jgi:steroid delta-isomerase-like uncharacterized protein
MGYGIDLWNQLDARLNGRDPAGAASLFTNDAVWIGPNSRDEGYEAIRAVFETVDNAFSELNRATSLVIEDGNAVVAEWIFQATVAESGKTLKHPGVTVSEIRDGKIATMRTYFDTADLMNQIGPAATT